MDNLNTSNQSVISSKDQLLEVLGEVYPYPFLIRGVKRVLKVDNVPEDEKLLEVYSGVLLVDLVIPYPPVVITDDNGIVRPIASNPTNVVVQMVLGDIEDEDVDDLSMVVDVFTTNASSASLLLGSTQMVNVLIDNSVLDEIEDVIDLEKASLEYAEMAAMSGGQS